MRILKSVEELLYELVTWILFYPLTMWRCLRHPVRMMAYAEAELSDDVPQQYDDALSPPILLLITLFLSHLLELRFGPSTHVTLPLVFQDERNLLLFRALAFSLFPLLFALHSVHLRGAKLSRQRLKPAFYSQCYTAAPFTLSVTLGLIIAEHGTRFGVPIGAMVFIAGLAWYLSAQTVWFSAKSDSGRARAFAIAAGTVILGFIALLLVTLFAAFAATSGAIS